VLQVNTRNIYMVQSQTELYYLLTVAKGMSQQHYNTFQRDHVTFRHVDGLFAAKCIGYSYN